MTSVTSLQRPPQPGRPLLGPALAQTEEYLRATESSAPQEPTIEKLATFYLQQASKIHISKRALSTLLTLDPYKIEPALNTLSSTVLQLDKMDRSNFEELIANSNVELIAYVDFHRYDDTPLRVKVEHLLPSSSTSLQPSTAVASTDTIQPPPAMPGSQPVVAKTAVRSKVLACENKFGMLLGLPAADGSDGLCN